MNTRFRLIFRGVRGGMYYCVDKNTGKRTSLQTTNEDEARQIVEAKNIAERQPFLNLQIAKAYIAGTDAGINSRTWRDVLEAIVNTKHGPNKARWLNTAQDRALLPLLPRTIIDTKGDDLLRTMQSGTVSTNVYLRRLHNFALDMNWLPWPILPKRQWPAVRYKEKRAITWEEHLAIITRESNPERRMFYECCWYLGAAQSDVAGLTAENIDWQAKTVSFNRRKTGTVSIVRFGRDLAPTLRALPSAGFLFPGLQPMREAHRSTEFARACRRVGVKGVTLHSYRYAWAERARTRGYPERFAQEALGHQSKAIHRAYARKAQVIIPAMEDYENKVVPLPAVAV